jgi:16S rRNA C967 or C1407 C5-methylase (RsmB/RsmF family)
MTLPADFRKRIDDHLGADAAAFYAELEKKSPTAISVHPRKFNRPVTQKPVLWNPHGYVLAERPAFIYDPWFHAGAYYVQEAGSQLVGALFDRLTLPENPTVLDLTAAPGGKSVLLANRMNGNGVLVSNEVIRSRVGVLRENLTKSGWRNVIITQGDPKNLGEAGALFDLILVDAPCSGEGLFRRDHAAREQWNEDLVQFCAARQKRILADIWPALKPGGYLIYSTCTLNKTENEANIEYLQSTLHAGLAAIQLPSEWNLEQVADAAWYCWPHRTGSEGFFAAVVRKPTDATAREIRLPEEKTVRITAPDGEYLTASTPLTLWKDVIVITTAHQLRLARHLTRFMPVEQCGTPVGVSIGGKFKPDSALALSLHFQHPAIDVAFEQVLAYLCGDGIMPEGAHAGWNAIAYSALPLGWINHLGRRSNNLWPQGWRIRQRPGADVKSPFWETA